VAKGRDSGMPSVDVWESFFEPGAILDALGCARISGDAVEFGCGYGTFTIAAARRVTGAVLALDIDPVMVRVTAARAEDALARNIIVEERDFVAAGSGRPDGSAACAILFNILHIENPMDLLREAHRILRNGGTAAAIHWRHNIETPRGPPLEIRPRPEQCAAWAEQAGFRARDGILDLPNSPWHWGMRFEKAVN